MKVQIYNKGKFRELYDFIYDKLSKKGILLTPPGTKNTALSPKTIGLFCYLQKIEDLENPTLEGITLNFDKKGLLFKRTELSVDFKRKEIFFDDRRDLPLYLDLAIIDYCYDKGYKFKIE